MSGKFTLEIRLGNDAMSDLESVARSLRKLAAKLERGVDSGLVMDDNGNRAGEFGIEAGED